MNKSNISTLSNEETLSYLLKEAKNFPLQTEFIPLKSAYNRILASDVFSDTNIPGANTSSRDGYCFKISPRKVFYELTTLKIIESEIHAGHTIAPLKDGECAYIATGGVLPKGADSVVPFETVELNKERNEITILAPIEIGDFVRPTGSEMKIGEKIATRFSKIDPELAGKIVSSGTFIVEVYKKPIVAILTSGDEIVMPWEKPQPWQVRTSNPTVMSMLVEKYGGKCLDFGIAKDTGDNMLELFSKAVVSADVIVTSGGIAMGRHDPVRNMFAKLGIESVFQKYGSHYRPIFYSVYKNKPIFALPGTPSGMMKLFEKFVGPFLEEMVTSTGDAKCNLQ